MTKTAPKKETALREDLKKRKEVIESGGWVFSEDKELGVFSAKHNVSGEESGEFTTMSALLDKLDGKGDELIDGGELVKTDDTPKDILYYSKLGWAFGNKKASKTVGDETIEVGPTDYLEDLFPDIDAIEANQSSDNVLLFGGKAGKSGKGVRGSRQPRLPGADDEKIEEIEEAINRTLDARIVMSETNKIYCDERDELLAVMHKHKITRYSRGDLFAQVTIEKENVKVKGPKKDPDSDIIDVEKDA